MTKKYYVEVYEKINNKDDNKKLIFKTSFKTEQNAVNYAYDLSNNQPSSWNSTHDIKIRYR